MKMKIAGAAMLVMSASATSATAETRCGWIENPTPANWSLADRDGEWVMGVQGGYQAPGMDLIPDLTASRWVASNGSYGYGCSCIMGTFDRAAMKLTRLDKIEQRDFAVCRADKTLPKQ